MGDDAGLVGAGWGGGRHVRGQRGGGGQEHGLWLPMKAIMVITAPKKATTPVWIMLAQCLVWNGLSAKIMLTAVKVTTMPAIASRMQKIWPQWKPMAGCSRKSAAGASGARLVRGGSGGWHERQRQSLVLVGIHMC